MINQPPQQPQQPQYPQQPTQPYYPQPQPGQQNYYGQPQMPYQAQPVARPKSGLSPNKIKWIGILAVLGVIGVGFTVFSIVRDTEASPFKANLVEYSKDYPFGGATDPYVTGKVVVVNKTEQKIDDPFFDLPTDVKAAKPEDVKTIVQIAYEQRQVGTYGGSGKAYQYTAYVTVIDKSTGKMVGKTSFEGTEPPSSVKKGSNGYGSKPTTEIKNYILQLPRR